MRKLSILLSSMLFASQAYANVSVSSPQVRLLPPSVPNSSAYFKLENSGQNTRTLISANSPLIKNVEIHNHVMVDGVMRMQEQSKIEIGSGKSVKFQPGGYHLMLFGIKTPLKDKQLVPINLVFENGEVVKVKAEVTADIAQQSHSHHHHHH